MIVLVGILGAVAWDIVVGPPDGWTWAGQIGMQVAGLFVLLAARATGGSDA